MPWTCAQCTADVGDDAVSACPECGQVKTAWTLIKDQTRRLRVGGKRFVCERGEDDAPRDAPLSEAYDAVTWAETEEAPAISTAEARRLAEAGQGPAPRDVLRVVQHPGKGEPSAVQLTVLPEARRSSSSEHAARQGPPHDARFLLVFGEAPDGVAFDGVEVIDVSDDRPEGHAPQVEVVALKRPFKTLTVVPRGPAIDWDLFSFDVGHGAETAEEPVQEAEEAGEEIDWGLFSFAVAESSDADGD